MVKASASRAEDLGFESRLRWDFFLGQLIPVTSKLALHWLPCQAPGVVGSVLGLVGSVSVYCDWVRWKVWSATSISVWEHVKLSEQIRPRDTLACCWDVKQPTNQQQSVLNVPATFKLKFRDGYGGTVSRGISSGGKKATIAENPWL